MPIKYLPRNVFLGLTSFVIASYLGIGCTTYREEMIQTCKGEIKVGRMEEELRAARYDGFIEQRNLGGMLIAYNNAACGPKEFNTCKDEILPLEELRRQLLLAKYDGPFDGLSELQAYNRAVCPERR